jgi:heparanase
MKTLLLFAAAASAAQPMQIDAGKLAHVHTIDERYQSFQIGFSHLTGGETWKSYDAVPKDVKEFGQVREARAPTDLSNRRLRNLTRALAPLYIRYSGTTANSVYFHDSDAPPSAGLPKGYTVVLTRDRWKAALEFAKIVDAKVITSFTNSEGVRNEDHHWTAKMAAPWMAYTRTIGGSIYAAELFNEPNAPEPPRLPKGITAEEFARDFVTFRGAMAQATPQTRIAGPGVATLGISGVTSIGGTSAEQYASADPKPKFDIVSYHFYPVLAQRCAPETSPQGISADRALDEEFLARPDKQLAEMKALRDTHAPGAPIWLTETGGAACGGLRWQPTFLDAFRYLDTHARLAKQGLDAIFTHALISGSNGIIDETTFEPNASYWAAVLWRRLMGVRVLDAGARQSGVNLYAHCLRGKAGGVALLAINIGTAPATLNVGNNAELYALTATELQSRTVLLNGNALAVTASDTLPAMKPMRVKGQNVTLAPTSIAFIALPKSKNANCAANAA